MQIKPPRGIRTSIPLRLFSRAPLISMAFFSASTVRRWMGVRIAYSPLRCLMATLERRGKHLRNRPGTDDISTMRSCAGTDIDQVIGGADAIFVVLDHENGVADRLQPLERADQAGVIALMQTDCRLIQHITHANQPRTHLRGQADALQLRRRRVRRSCDRG